MGQVKPLVEFLYQEDSQAPSHHSEEPVAELITGLSSSARTLSVAEKWLAQRNQLLLVTEDTSSAERWASDLAALIDSGSIYLFPNNDLFHAQMSVSSPEAQGERVTTLDFLLSDQPGIVIATVASLRKIIAPPELFAEHRLQIDFETLVDLDDLTKKLVTMGYRREQLVASTGEFSVRGGIIDIYPLGAENPVRIELFGDEIDSMRIYNPEDQRSVDEIELIEVLPYTDLLISQAGRERTAEVLQQTAPDTLKDIEDKEEKLHWQTQVEHWLTLLESGEWTDDLQAFAASFYGKSSSILDYLNPEAEIIFDEYTHLLERSQKIDEEKEEWLTDRPLHEHYVKSQPLIIDWDLISRHRNHSRLYYSLFRRGLGHLEFDRLTEYNERPVTQFFGQLDMLAAEIERYRKQNYTLIIMSQSEKRAQEIQRTFQEYGLPEPIEQDGPIEKGQIQIVPYTLLNGFEWADFKLALLTEKELFNQVKKKRPRRKQLTNAERLKDYTDLNIGDYVVHLHHGIGRYLGMETLEIQGKHHDYLTIAYRGDDKVYVPVDQFDLVQKYVSAEGKAPAIHKLGGTRWAKTKARVTKQVEDIADDLLEIYAERESRRGYAYPPLDAYYREFENDFPYTETPDQLRSIREVNDDLSKSKPMDRLLVGDVGYGKTEIAMRAAFRVAEEGRQVAFLVPTTVLAQQHYDTLRERFSGYPIAIQMLSRFRTAKESNQIKEDLAQGKIDIIVGTHRLLSKDIKYKDLGLLIIDEEQRFGVKHKEKIKKIKSEVDVLTLTATPIPRTLHMSIVGARDLSLIETPPANRYPVQTHVLEMNGFIIREAIERELSRGGQVFYLHNRVETIEKRVRDLEKLVPDARIAYAHGQMSEVQLENILYDFIRHEYDVLVTTTIIETGVDIPNANTLLIEDADRMGLSQLYQLRGRVGRSNRIAYAYLMYEPNKLLTEESEKRLKAIQDFTELGSGFKIAMRDLSIRGAGNLLGSQQSGFIDSVGFDLYSQMLADMVAKKQGKEAPEKTSAEIDLSVEAYIPEAYISDEAQKIDIYKKVRALESKQDYIDLQDELIDRFGDYPSEVTTLLLIGLLKMYSDGALVDQISQNKKKISVEFSEKGASALPMPEVFKALSLTNLKASIDAENEDELAVHFEMWQSEVTDETIEQLILFTHSLYEYLKDDGKED